jgi:hypothetical protein
MAESLDVRAGPNDTCSMRLLQSPSALAHVHGDSPVILGDRKDTGQHSPGLVGDARPIGHTVSARLEFSVMRRSCATEIGIVPNSFSMSFKYRL